MTGISAKSEARRAIIQEFWPLGYSASQIALKIGGGCTRSMVIGLKDRMKLEPRLTKYLSPAQIKIRRVMPSKPLPPPKVDAPEPLNMGLMAISDKNCRWPVNDGPDWLFCGHGVWQKKKYCPYHAGLASSPAPQRVRA